MGGFTYRAAWALCRFFLLCRQWKVNDLGVQEGRTVLLT
jgi:hypothetical protein